MDWLRPPSAYTTIQHIIDYLAKLIAIYEYDYDNQVNVITMEKMLDYYLELQEQSKWKPIKYLLP